jgi:hypothetical protein
MPKRINRKTGNSIAAAFILGILFSIIMPGWWWVLIVGVMLIMAGYKILID